MGAAVATTVEMLEQRWMLSGEGLQGSFYESANNAADYNRDTVMYSTPKGTRVDPQINFIQQGPAANQDPNGGGAFNYGGNPSNNRIENTGLTEDQYFNGRWEGTVTIPATGTYQFATRSDDGVRLWVNGNNVVDQWNIGRDVNAAPGDVGNALTFTAGQQIPVLLEFNQGVGGAAVGLYWSYTPDGGNQIPFEFIPQANLNSAVAAPAVPTGPVTPTVLGAVADSAFAATISWTDNANNETYYLVEKSSNNGTTWTTVAKVRPDNTATGARTFGVGGLSPLTSYKFRVTVRNFSDETAASTAANSITSGTITTGAPPIDSPGLVGQYFEAPGNAGYNRDKVSVSTPVGVRIDPAIDFLDPATQLADDDVNKGSGQEQGPFNGAFNGVNVSNNRIGGTGLADDQFFTTRWEGQLVIPTNGIPGTIDVVFNTRSDDGMRFILGDTNNDTLIDHWNDNRGVPGMPGDAPTHTVTLTKGQSYSIVVEFNQGNGGAGAGLYWSSTDALIGARKIVPAINPGDLTTGGLKFHVDLPAAPSALAVLAPGGQAETLSWLDNSNNEARFRIDYKPVGAPDSAYVVGAAWAAPNATSGTVLGLTSNTNYTFRISAVNYAGVVTAATTVDGNTGTTIDLGAGIIGEYREAVNNAVYDRNEVSNRTPVGIRVDPQINFGDLNGQIAGTGLTDTDSYTVRWEGMLKVPGTNDGSTGTYTFYVQSDDGERLYVNGVKLTDFWTANRGFPALPGDTGVITLKHGTEVPIVFEMNEGGGGAGAVIRVQNDAENIPLTVIPTSFFHAKVTLPNAPTSGSASNATPVSVQLNWTDNSLNEARYRIEQAVETSPGVFGPFTATQFVTPVFDATTDPANPVGQGAGSTVVGGLSPGKNYKFRIIAMNYAGDSAPIEVTATTTVGGPGVIAQYFNVAATGNEPFFYSRTTGLPLAATLTRIDTQINTNWGTNSPAPGIINGDNFMSRYSGKITITQAGTYTFRVNSDDASYAWINGRLVSQYPGGHGAGNASTDFPITLAAGTYPLIFEQAEGGGGAAAILNYNGPDSGNALIPVPTTALTAEADLPAVATGLVGTPGPTSIAFTWNENSLNEYMAHVEYKLTSSSTWIVADPRDVVNNPNSAPAAQSFTVTGLLPQTSYDFRVVDTNFAGDAISAPITVVTPSVPPGSLVLKPIAVATGNHNLTTEGNLDWIHFGFPATPTKSHLKGGVVGPQLAPYTVIGGGTVAGFSTTGSTFTWTDAAGGAVSATDVTAPGDPIVGIPNSGNGAAQDMTKAIDNDTTTKYLNFAKLGTGFVVTPASGPSTIGGIALTSANDAAERDPTSYEVYGSNDGGATFTPIAAGTIPAFTSRGQERVVNFARPAGKTYTTYKVIFPTVANAATANSMQIAEVKLLSAAAGENAAATPDAVAITGDGKGFHFTVPASTLLRRARFYLGVDGGSGNLTLTMSDGSVLPATQVNVLDDNAAGAKLFVYEVDFKSGLDGQTLGVDWTAAGGGTVVLSAVTWIDFVAPAAPTNVAAVGTSKGRANVSWTDNATNETGYLIERSPTLNGTYVAVGQTGPNAQQFVDSGLAVNTTYFYRVSAVNVAATVPQGTAPVSALTKNIIQTGLRGRFWNDEGADVHVTQNTNDPVLTRRDNNVDVDWGTGTPDPVVNIDNFSSQWDGTYIADYTGAYTFFTGTDDGGRLFIDLNGNGVFDYDAAAADANRTLANGELVVNSWVDQGVNANGDGVTNGRGLVVNLVAGTEYKIMLNQFEHGGGAGAHLFAQPPGQPKVAVPTGNLIPAVIDVAPPALVGNPEVDQALPATATYTSKQHIVIHFTEKVGTVSSSSITVTDSNGNVYGGPTDPLPTRIGWTFDAASNSGIITFPGVPDADPQFDQSLPNGNYTITLSAAGVKDLSGNQLDGDNDGTAGGDYSFKFYIFRGDTQNAVNGTFNGDRKVSFVDFQRFELNFGKTPAERPSNGEGDFNHDGFVDEADFVILNNNMGGIQFGTLPSAPVGAPAPAPVPVSSKPVSTPVPSKPVTTKPVTQPVKKPVVAPPVKKPAVVAKPPAKVTTKPIVTNPVTVAKNAFGAKKISSLKELLAGH